MRWQGEELVKVRSESELRAGMMVFNADCDRCPKGHCRILTRVSGESCFEHGGRAWWVTAGCFTAGNAVCFHLAIGNGQLYKLPPEKDSTERTRSRELEGSR